MKPAHQLSMPGDPPKGLNGSQGITRRGVHAHKVVKDEWAGRALSAWTLANRPRIERPSVLVWIRLFAGRERLMDSTNVLASAKVPEDALVNVGFLPDDSPEWVRHSLALQRKVEPGERGLLVLAFDAPRSLGRALANVSHWVESVWESEDAWRTVLGEYSKPYAEGSFRPRRGATPQEWLHGAYWKGEARNLWQDPHLEVVHRLTDPTRGWEAGRLVHGHINAIKNALAKDGVLVGTHSYREERVTYFENQEVLLRLHEPTPLARATA